MKSESERERERERGKYEVHYVLREVVRRFLIGLRRTGRV